MEAPARARPCCWCCRCCWPHDAQLAEALAEALAERDAARAERDATRLACAAVRAELSVAQAKAKAERAARAAALSGLAAAGGGPAPAPVPAAPPFRGPAADSLLGEHLINVLPFVAENGFAIDVSQHVALCGATWRAGQLGATNDVMVRSLAMQAPWAAAARRMGREDFAIFGYINMATSISAARRS